jgi:NAD(P)-dependent dehydrogenase (short-subunit alcohol dehydrogenase family)
VARILVTGSTDGLGYHTAEALLDDGHSVVVHARAAKRLTAVKPLLDRGADSIVADLAKLDDVYELAKQANASGRFDAVIHNAGVLGGPPVLPVNVVAPYVLTAEMHRPDRLIYLSSGMHRGGRADLAGADWSGTRGTGSYSDSKLFVTALMAGVSRLWPDVLSSAVDPGWVPTRMGGANAPDDLRLGHLTQVWLATSHDSRALVSGQYWHHQRPRTPHPAVHDERFQTALLDSLADYTGTIVAPG